MSPLGRELTHWTIRLALACMVGVFTIRLTERPFGRHSAMSRALWTLGCVFFIGHVIAAFHYFHRWSHAHALQVTADRTLEQLGIAFGEGIYFSYVFGLWWMIDVAWMWLSPERHAAMSARVAFAATAYMAFIAFNGAVVFEDGPTRPLGIGAILFLACLAFFAWRRGPLAASASDAKQNSEPGAV